MNALKLSRNIIMSLRNSKQVKSAKSAKMQKTDLVIFTMCETFHIKSTTNTENLMSESGFYKCICNASGSRKLRLLDSSKWVSEVTHVGSNMEKHTRGRVECE